MGGRGGNARPGRQLGALGAILQLLRNSWVRQAQAERAVGAREEQAVGGLDVLVDDADGVEGLERRHQLPRQRQPLAQGQPRARPARHRVLGLRGGMKKRRHQLPGQRQPLAQGQPRARPARATGFWG